MPVVAVRVESDAVHLVKNLLYIVAFLFLVTLVIRLVFDWIQMFARDWKPAGVVLLAAEGVYSVTDPPLRALRRIVPPLRIGSFQLDLAFTLLFLIVIVLMRVLS
jgi:YggT family protein